MNNISKSILAGTLLGAAGLALADAECVSIFKGEIKWGKDINLCSVDDQVIFTVGHPNKTPEINIQAKQKDVLYEIGSAFIEDRELFVFSLFIPGNEKWYGLSLTRYEEPEYTFSTLTGENLNKSNFHNHYTIESAHPIPRRFVTARIETSLFTRMEAPKGEKEYQNYLQSFYTLTRLANAK